jgi:hypothetical protein
LERDDWGRLVLVDANGERHAGIEVRRAFPLSDPQRSIALCDGEGHELVWLDGMDQLPPDTRQVLADYLAQHEFLPLIRRVISVSTDADPSQWSVETDRGPTQFLLASEDDVHRQGEHGAMVVDSFGVRYLVRDLRTLDNSSRRILERYL